MPLWLVVTNLSLNSGEETVCLGGRSGWEQVGIATSVAVQLGFLGREPTQGGESEQRASQPTMGFELLP